MTYQTQEGEPVPDDVEAQLAHPDDWEHMDPENIAVLTWDELYHVVTEDGEVYMDDRGYSYDPESFETVERFQPDAVPYFGRPYHRPFSYNETPDVVSHDHFREHVTRVIVVDRGNVFKLNSRSGVLWISHDSEEVSSDSIELAISLSETKCMGVEDHCEISDPVGLTRVANGWHSSVERSKLSEMINALTRGDVDPAWHDEHRDDIYPYAVKFGDTKNSCSQPLSVYATDVLATELEHTLKNAWTKPGFATI